MKTILSKYRKLLNHPIDDADINQMIIYLENKQIKKLHYEYGNTVLLMCLRFCESREDYISCATIKKFIEEHNKYAENKIEVWNIENILKP